MCCVKAASICFRHVLPSHGGEYPCWCARPVLSFPLHPRYPLILRTLWHSGGSGKGSARLWRSEDEGLRVETGSGQRGRRNAEIAFGWKTDFWPKTDGKGDRPGCPGRLLPLRQLENPPPVALAARHSPSSIALARGQREGIGKVAPVSLSILWARNPRRLWGRGFSALSGWSTLSSMPVLPHGPEHLCKGGLIHSFRRSSSSPHPSSTPLNPAG
jgi:hypothetical protein